MGQEAAAGEAREEGGRSEAPRVLFVTREPVMHTFHGAIAAVHNLLQLLVEHGCEVTVLVTGGASRSPRLLFREAVPLPAGAALRVPGYWRCGRWRVRPFCGRGFARLLLRVVDRGGWSTEPLLRALRAVSVDVFDRAWDLTEPTAGERALVEAEVERLCPDAVAGNYAFWGPLLRDLRAGSGAGDETGGGVRRGKRAPRTLILMHDLLAGHVRGFAEQGLPLDCNRITLESETAWLNGADR